MWILPKKKVSRTVIVIKYHTESGIELYLVRGSFFSRMGGLKRDDYNCPRSKHGDLIHKVAVDFFLAPLDALPICGKDPFVLHDVNLKGKRKRFDLSVYFIHANEQHTLLVNEHCTLLSKHPRLDSLLRKRAEQSTIVEEVAEAKSEAA
jgi:hypothetical protein